MAAISPVVTLPRTVSGMLHSWKLPAFIFMAYILSLQPWSFTPNHGLYQNPLTRNLYTALHFSRYSIYGFLNLMLFKLWTTDNVLQSDQTAYQKFSFLGCTR